MVLGCQTMYIERNYVKDKRNLWAHNYRGVRDDSTMITLAVGGVFRTDASAKSEFISLLKLK